MPPVERGNIKELVPLRSRDFVRIGEVIFYGRSVTEIEQEMRDCGIEGPVSHSGMFSVWSNRERSGGKNIYLVGDNPEGNPDELAACLETARVMRKLTAGLDVNIIPLAVQEDARSGRKGLGLIKNS